MLFCFIITNPFEEVIILIVWRKNWGTELLSNCGWWQSQDLNSVLSNFENWVISPVLSYLQAPGHDGEHKGGTGLGVEYGVGVNSYVLDPVESCN